MLFSFQFISLSHGFDKLMVCLGCFFLKLDFVYIDNSIDQVKRISGYTANPKFLSQLTVCYIFDSYELFLF